MAQSPEYPDLKWMPPKSWTNANRTAVQLIVIHTTEGHEKATSAEDGAANDQHRTDGTSTHYFHDDDSTVQCVVTADQAHAARTQGNRRGIQHELCGQAGQGKAGWADAFSQGELRRAARQCARDTKKWGIPVRRLTVAQVAGGDKGFCGHVDVTYAFPQDNGTHTDPGPNFPWSQFLDLVRAELEDDMTKADFIEWLKDDAVRAALCRAVAYTDGVLPAPAGSTNADGKPNEFWTLWGYVLNNYKAATAARDKDAVDEQALAAALAAALPAGVQVTEAQLQAALVGALRELAA